MIDVNSPIIQSGLSFQIILREPENQKIFDVDKNELVVGYASDYLNKALKVISIKVIESELYGLIVRGTNIIGWTRLNHSIKLISKPIDTIRVDLLDMITNFQEERKESKSAIVRLINENISLQKTNKNEEKNQYERLYMNLKNSKLGKIQTKYWSWRNRRKS